MTAGSPFLTTDATRAPRRSAIPPRFRVSLALAARRPSRQTFRIALSALLPPALILSLLLLLSLLGLNFNRTDADYGCDPNGNVWVTASNRPNLWSAKYGLAISLGFGKFAYTPVRIIDVAWDWLVARGVQVLAAWLVWKVFKGPIALAIQREEGVRYETIMKMQYDTASLGSFLTYMRDLFRRKRSAYQYFIAAMLVLSVAYVLVAPTFVQAMTGYQPETIPLLKLQNSTYVSFAELGRCSYTVQDGERIGLSSMACVPPGAVSDALTLYFSQYITYNLTSGWSADALSPSAIQRISVFRVAGQPVRHLHPPLLNITLSGFQDPLHAANFDGKSLSAAYPSSHGYCAPQNTYVWGFSLILLFLFLCITFIFCVLIYVVWITHLRNTYCSPTRDPGQKVFGDLRTAFTVVQSLQDDLGAAAAAEMSEEALTEAFKERGGVVRLRRSWQSSGRGGGDFSSARLDAQQAMHSPHARCFDSQQQPSARLKNEADVFWKEIGISPTHTPDEKGYV